MADKNTIKDWFRTGLKPTQAQFWATWDSFWHKDEKIPITAIEDIENILNEKADAEAFDNHVVDAGAHADLFNAKEDKNQKGVAGGYAPLDELNKLAVQYLNIVNDLVTGGSDSLLSAEQGKLLQNQIDNINVLLTSDNVNLDNVQEIVDAIETVQMSLSTILVNDLTTGGTTKALTAEMGKLLQTQLNGKQALSTVTDFSKSYIAPYTTGNIRNSEADVLKLNDGKYLTAYSKFSRVSSDFGVSTIAAKISTDSSGVNWGSEILISENIGTNNILSVSLIRIDASTIHCFFVVRNSFTDLELNRVMSTNEGLTWSTPVVITSNGYTDILNASVKRGNSNRILIPGESTPDGSVESPTWDIFCYRSDDNGITYTKSNIVHVATSQGETSVVWTGGNDVMLSTRTTSGFQYFTKSTDNGTTFGAPFLSTLKSVNAPAQIINYSGTLIALHNPNTIDDLRNPLSISKSLDGGITWTEIANVNLARPNYYVYAYPSVTLDGDYMLITYHEISGDGGLGLKFSKIYIPDLLIGIIPKSDSPNTLFLKGLTFDKSDTIQPEDNVLVAFGKLQAQINKKEGAALVYKGIGPGVILQNDRSDNNMQTQFISYRNTDGTVVTNIGHLGSGQEFHIYSIKDIVLDAPSTTVKTFFKVNGSSTFTDVGMQATFIGASQGAIDIKRGATQGFRLFTDVNNFGLYDLINNATRLEISTTTGDATFYHRIIVNNVIRLKSYKVSTLPAGTQGDTAYVTDAIAPTYLGVLTGGGSVKCPVFYNGTAWVSN